MNGLTFAPAYDSGGAHPHDATGAFQPGARAFSTLHGLPPPHLFDNRPASMRVRRLAVLDVIRATPGPLDVIALFSHGRRRGTQWGGVNEPVVCDEIATVIASVAAPDVVIALYACSTGEDVSEAGHDGVIDNAPGAGEGGFADRLRDAVLAHGKRPRVLAHTTAGHAFRNPYVRVFDASTDKGGEWLIAPGSPDWHAWVKALAGGDLWARMPFMQRDAVQAELAQAPTRHGP